MPPEAVPGVGSVGRVGIHHHQDVLLVLRESRGRHCGQGVTARSPKIPLFPLFPSRCALRVGSPQRGARNGCQGRPQTRSGMIESQIFPEEKCGFCLLQRKGPKENSLCFQPSSHRIPPWPITGFLGSRGDWGQAGCPILHGGGCEEPNSAPHVPN